MSAAKPYIPIYAREPNKLIRIENRRFDDASGHSGIERVAVYLHKNKELRECTAQVVWD